MNEDNQQEKQKNLEETTKNSPTLFEWIVPVVGGITYIMRAKSDAALNYYMPGLLGIHAGEILFGVGLYRFFN